MNKLLLLLSLVAGSLLSAKQVKVVLILDKAGKDDKSFNASAVLGAEQAEKKFQTLLKVEVCADDTAIENSLRTFAKFGYDLIVAIGMGEEGAVRKVAAEFPKTHFLLVDGNAERPNVRSVKFREKEGAYLIGSIAAMTTRTNRVGFIGGVANPIIKRFEDGYREGVQSVNPGIVVLSDFVGVTSDAWKNPAKAKAKALFQYSQGVDIIFVAAGASSLGAFEAADQTKRFAIGSDSNQNWIKPGRILTSMLKRIDLVVLKAIEAESNGSFQPGMFSYGIAEGAVDYVVDGNNRQIFPDEVEKKANSLKIKILNKSLVIPD